MKTKLLFILFIACISAKAQTMAGSLGHSLFICSDGTVSSCGFNQDGQLGDGTVINSINYVQVTGLSSVTKVAAAPSYGHSLFVKSDSTAWACGANQFFQLGNGSTDSSSVPVQVSGLTEVVAVAAGESHSLFLKNDGTVWACGNNFKGQIAGDSATVTISIPEQIDSLNNIIAIAAGYWHSLFLKSDGTVWACGYNLFGQIGDGTFNNDRFMPVQVSGLSDIVAIAATGHHSLFLKNDGTVWGCGSNNGELGTGNTSDVYLPAQVTGLSNITAISSGAIHFLYLKNDSTVWACGSNVKGQLGDGTTGGKTTAFQIPSLTGVVAIQAAGFHSFFRKSDGSTWACGYNALGQFGNGTTADSHIPVPLTGLCSATGISENIQDETIIASPNPFSSETIIHTGKNKDATLTVYNVTGQKVKEIKNISTEFITLQREGLQSGLYFIRLTEAGKMLSAGKLVIAD